MALRFLIKVTHLNQKRSEQNIFSIFLHTFTTQSTVTQAGSYTNTA